MVRTIYDKAEDMFDEVFKELKLLGFSAKDKNELELLQGRIRFKILYDMKKRWEKDMQNHKIVS